MTIFCLSQEYDIQLCRYFCSESSGAHYSTGSVMETAGFYLRDIMFATCCKVKKLHFATQCKYVLCDSEDKHGLFT
jgi:hypothetical protein